MNKGFLITIFALLVLVGGYFAWSSFTQESEQEFCIQVITSARNPETGGVREFPTPCDVPEGWVAENGTEENPNLITDYSKPFQMGNTDYYGTLTLTGYITIEDRQCDPEGEALCTDGTPYKYVTFNFTDSDNDLVYDYLNLTRGSSSNASFGIGCYYQDRGTIESENAGDDRWVHNIISKEDTNTLLNSSKTKQVKLKLSKSHVTYGSGAPNCYSVFRDFEIIK